MGKTRGHRSSAAATQRLPEWGAAILRLIAAADIGTLRYFARALKHLLSVCDERLADLEHGAKSHEGHEGKEEWS